MEEKKERVAAVTLSITAAAKARQRKKDAEAGEAGEDNEEAAGGGKKDVEEKADDTPAKKEKEARSFHVENPGRVTQRQRAFMAPIADQRYNSVFDVADCWRMHCCCKSTCPSLALPFSSCRFIGTNRSWPMYEVEW